MVKITVRTKGVAHLKSHLAYGELNAETEQGASPALSLTTGSITNSSLVDLAIFGGRSRLGFR